MSLIIIKSAVRQLDPTKINQSVYVWPLFQSGYITCFFFFFFFVVVFFFCFFFLLLLLLLFFLLLLVFFLFESCRLFNIKICSIQGKEIALFSGYIQPIFLKQSTSHIRMWALFINIQCIHILNVVFANIRSKCNIRGGNVGSVNTYICFKCLQILHTRFKQAVCLWKVLIFACAIPWIERSKKCAPFQDTTWYSHLVFAQTVLSTVCVPLFAQTFSQSTIPFCLHKQSLASVM